MIRINIIILIMLFSILGCKAQDFYLFDEEVVGNTIFLTPKGKSMPVLKAEGYTWGFEYPFKIENVRNEAVVFFKIFEPLTSSERDILRRVHAEIFFTNELKMSYYEIGIPKECRDFFLAREQKLVQWVVESFSDMSKDRKEFNIVNPDTFEGSSFMVHIRGFYIHASDLLPENGSR
ncbi:hypothetical protein [Parabacteroides gordonii]|jgi:hypothetical protein|uniref:hypothetical protein n=1 Tax=Parabacteroides gordonii TaxID=574930 RepID=UPI00241C3B09|nr:hypothetical protein [Parabacteroides gordonii]